MAASSSQVPAEWLDFAFVDKCTDGYGRPVGGGVATALARPLQPPPSHARFTCVGGGRRAQLERVLLALRSGQESVYPELATATAKRLAEARARCP